MSSALYSLVRPLLFRLDPVKAHAAAFAAMWSLEHLGAVRSVVRSVCRPTDPRLQVRTMGLVFPSPVGLAGGFDKNAERPRALAALGFGHLEMGTVTAEAQGPLTPFTMARLPRDRAIINRLGFPNEGAARVAARLRDKKKDIGVPVGVSIGKSRSVPLEPFEGVLADYRASFHAVRDVADFVVVNVSSPNTKDLRALQVGEMAKRLFAMLAEEASTSAVPLLVKVAPDLDDESIAALCAHAKAASFEGVVATNTTVSRKGLSTSTDEVERIGEGGLSGAPLLARALDVVRMVRSHMGADACVVGVGGIDSTDTTLAMLRAGASLVQIYTGFVYRGPSLPRTITRGLSKAMDAEGARSIRDLIDTVSPSQAEPVSIGI